METEQFGSHTEDVHEETQDPSVQEALALFDLVPTEQEEQEEIEETEDLDEIEEPPAIVEPKKLVVKVNKEDREVSEDEIPELVQKGFGLEKERERREKYESALTRAAKLAGYDDVNTYLTNLDTIEQQAVQQKEDSFNSLRQNMIDELEAAGYEPEKVTEFIDNHPLLKQAEDVLAREKQSQELTKQQQAEADRVKGWEELLTEYPHLVDEIPEGGPAPWITPEMQMRIDRGYSPLDAYVVTNKDKISGNQRKLTEQEIIKQQRLNKRAAVLGDTKEDLAPSVPKELSDAFALFGIEPKAAQKYVKK